MPPAPNMSPSGRRAHDGSYSRADGGRSPERCHGAAGADGRSGTAAGLARADLAGTVPDPCQLARRDASRHSDVDLKVLYHLL